MDIMRHLIPIPVWGSTNFRLTTSHRILHSANFYNMREMMMVTCEKRTQ